jgi:hypothetical protein
MILRKDQSDCNDKSHAPFFSDAWDFQFVANGRPLLSVPVQMIIDRNESNETRPQGERRRDSTTSTVRSLFDRERSRSTFVTIYIQFRWNPIPR